MSNDTKAIIATVVAIGGLVLGQGFYLNARIDDVSARIGDVNANVNARIGDVNTNVNARIDDLRSEMNRRLDSLQADIRELRALVTDALKGSEPAD